MEVRAARQHAERLVRAVAAHVRAQRDRMRALAEEGEVRPVRVVNEQRHAELVRGLGQRGDVLHSAEVVRRSYVNCTRRLRHA